MKMFSHCCGAPLTKRGCCAYLCGACGRDAKPEIGSAPTDIARRDFVRTVGASALGAFAMLTTTANAQQIGGGGLGTTCLWQVPAPTAPVTFGSRCFDTVWGGAEGGTWRFRAQIHGTGPNSGAISDLGPESSLTLPTLSGYDTSLFPVLYAPNNPLPPDFVYALTIKAPWSSVYRGPWSSFPFGTETEGGGWGPQRAWYDLQYQPLPPQPIYVVCGPRVYSVDALCAYNTLTVHGEMFPASPSILIVDPNGGNPGFTIVQNSATDITLRLNAAMIPGQYCVTVS